MPETISPSTPKPNGTRPPRGATEQVSYSGTPRWRDGETRPDDYVTELANPLRRMMVFEEMRSSDEAVNTAIEAREQLISSANWMLGSADESARGVEIKEFCEDNLYPVLDDLLLQLAGAIQYGVGLVEPVYAWSDGPFAKNVARGKVRRATKSGRGRKIYLRKIARIRQRTVYTFDVSEQGDLRRVVQWVFTGSSFRRIEIPAEKLLLWVYRQQGDDFWGYPPTRKCYKAWSFKGQIEKLSLLGIDRFGVGVPVAEGGPDWTDADFDRLFKFLKNWRGGADQAAVTPHGGKIDIKSAEGSLFGSLLDFVKWYALGIAKTYLTQGTELGSTETGNRALGEVFTEQAEGVVQADCEKIAAVLNERLIVPLVEWNFGVQETYPLFTPSQRVRQSAAIANMINGWVEKGLIKPTAADEAWARDVAGLPEIDVEARQAEMDEEEAAQRDLQEQLANAKVGGEEEDDEPAPPKAAARVLARRAGRVGGVRSGQLRGVPGVMGGGRRPIRALASGASVERPTYRTREFSEWEAQIVKPQVLGRDLDLEEDRLTGEVQEVLRAINAALAALVARYAARGAAALADGLQQIVVAEAQRRRLREVLTEAAERAQTLGASSVATEIARQARPDVSLPPMVDAPPLTGPAPDPAALAEARTLALRAEVERAVADEIARRETSARSAVSRAIAQSGTASPDQLAGAAHAVADAALEDLSPQRTRENVGGVVNAGFGTGRREKAAQLAAEGGIIAKVYSAVMDLGTCDECAKWDAARFPIDAPEDHTGVQAPNPRCHGTLKRCRCIWVYQRRTEAAAA